MHRAATCGVPDGVDSKARACYLVSSDRLGAGRRWDPAPAVPEPSCGAARVQPEHHQRSDRRARRPDDGRRPRAERAARRADEARDPPALRRPARRYGARCAGDLRVPHHRGPDEVRARACPSGGATGRGGAGRAPAPQRTHRRPVGACVFCPMLEIDPCDYEAELRPLSAQPQLTADSPVAALNAEKHTRRICWTSCRKAWRRCQTTGRRPTSSTRPRSSRKGHSGLLEHVGTLVLRHAAGGLGPPPEGQTSHGAPRRDRTRTRTNGRARR